MFKILFRLTVFVLLIALLSCQEYADQTYEGYSLYRVFPQNDKQVEKLRSLMTENRDGNAFEFWTEPNVYGGPVDIMASPKEQEAIQDQLKIHRIPYKTIMYDVGEVIRRTQRIKTWPKSLSYSDINNTSIRLEEDNYLDAKNFFTGFQRYSMIEEKLKELAKDPRVVLEYPGSSYEGRQMYLVKVSSDPAANKPVIFIDAGHHAREWISHSTLLYILESLINDNMPKYGRKQRWFNPSEDTKNEMDTENKAKLVRDIKTKLDDYDFWFVPVINPDGYEHTHTADRLWRKTRSRGTFCNGVDPNRNYPVHWREVGASAFPCDSDYAGPHPLSEPETKILAETLSNNQNRIKMYISLHSYSQLLLTPYGHTNSYPENWKDLETVASAGVTAIYSLRGTLYRYGPSAVVLYPASGGSDDFAYVNTKIKFSYTFELPDTGQHGFLAPPREIIPVGQETSNGIAAMIEALKNLQ